MGYRRRNRILVFVMSVIFLVVMLPHPVLGLVPQRINFQGYLTDPTGNPVADGDYEMDFAIYDVPTGGTALWLESQTVMVINGIYNVQIGVTTETNEFPNNLFEGARYLGIIIAPDSVEMVPRQLLTCTPFAMRAEVADKVSNDAIGTSHIIDGSVAVDDLDTASVDTHYVNEAQADSISLTMIQDGAALAEIMDDDGSGSGLDADQLDGYEASHFATANYVAQLEARVVALETLLQGITRSGNDIYIDSANLHIRNGTGTTDGAVNGLGNLIVGYNELRGFGDNRSGSHNIVGGIRSNYSSYGGLVVGYNNTISGIYSTATGGYYATASGGWSSVSGGNYNTASNFYSSVSGGVNNTASGQNSSVSGGNQNTASGNFSSISGGRWNTASGQYAFVGGGGYTNSADGNIAFADYSAILGGRANVTGDMPSGNHTLGQYSAISGGLRNMSSGNYSSVSGGQQNTASGSSSSVSGGTYNDTIGNYSSVSGGSYNEASGENASVSGGTDNTAIGNYSSVSGGISNEAGSTDSSVSGGANNTASGNFSSVSGGQWNTASGQYAFVGGGESKTAPSTYSTGALPDYDSGWITISDHNLYLTHNLGGNPDNYIVNVEQTSASTITKRTNAGFGGDRYQIDTGYTWTRGGFWYRLLDDTRILLERGDGTTSSDEFRVRIWVNN